MIGHCKKKNQEKIKIFFGTDFAMAYHVWGGVVDPPKMGGSARPLTMGVMGDPLRRGVFSFPPYRGVGGLAAGGGVYAVPTLHIISQFINHLYFGVINSNLSIPRIQ